MPVVKPIQIGDVVAEKYRLLDIIGEGGMGVVYLAEHNLIEKRVALKVLRAEYSSKPEVVGRFQQEAISASRIKHPNVLDVFDFGRLDNGSFFLAMEYLQGHDLAAELSAHTTIETDRALRITLQITRALAAAHARGVVHRDLKPENVFLHETEEGDEVVKIVDFGIAQLKGRDDGEPGTERRRRLTRAGMIFGTPEYMSPEQAAGHLVDLRADIYATGVMLYEMFTGAVPFSGSSFMAVLSAHLTKPVPPMRQYFPELDISPELEAAVMRALEKEPEARFQSMREFATALQQADEGRLASPLGGLVPLPEVTIKSFRPARGVDGGTPTLIGRGDQGLADVGSREVLSERSNPRPSEPLRGVMFGSAAATVSPSDESDAPAAGLPFAPPSRDYAPEARHGRAILIAIAVLAILAGGSATYTYLQYRSRQLTVSSQNGRAIAGNPNGQVPATNESVRSGAPASAAVAASTTPLVVLTVQTNLVGATVAKDGFQVCDKTPCSIEVERGAATELVAVKGGARGTAKVLAQKDQTVTINLAFPKASPPKGKAAPGLCEVTVDGLKILRPCP